ncbi:MAG TPA: Gfo/Idh/MocA family oxidoreductase [Phycisphaerae bacterium]|nr:Gfo/Idh/MocA family oxidoreductase [Phycisphaerae bacterium]
MGPIKLAVIGAGRRTCDTYCRLLPALGEFFEVVAVCDPVAEAAGAAAERFGVPAFAGVRDLVKAGVAEAALIATPPETHHAVSVFLSRAGMHHVCETPMAVTAGLCRQMIGAAGSAAVVLHVNEQFFRLPLIAFCRRPIDAGVIGAVGRVTYFHGHTGYHNNSVWQHFGGGAPSAVNTVTAPEFTAAQAVLSAEMESAFALSAERDGQRVALPTDAESESDRATLAAFRRRFGVDPTDIDAMIDVGVPSDYMPEART